MNKKAQPFEQCRLCCIKGFDQIDLQRETVFSQYVAETIGQHVKEADNENLPKFVCLICWGKVEKFHLFSESVKLAQAKYLRTFKLADPLPDVVDDVMCVDDIDDIDIDETPASLPQMNQVEFVRDEQSAVALKQLHSLKAVEGNDSDNSDEQNQEESDDVTTTPWFSGLSEAEREEMVRQYFDMSCEVCLNVIFKSDTEAHWHYLKKHQKMGYIRCCDKRYYDKISVYNHIEYHKFPENFRCKVCMLQFKTKSGVRRHAKHHRVRMLAEKSRQFVCHICDRDFVHENMLRIHLRRIHDEGIEEDESSTNHTYICEHCGQSYGAYITLEKHIQSKHMEQVRVNCKICNASLSQFSLYAHMQNIHSSKPQKCPHCDKISPNKAALTNHLREVHKFADLKCKFCEKTFKTQRSLRGHEATHTGVKEHTCKFCKRAFTHKSSMYCHQKRMHTEEWAKLKSSSGEQNDFN